MEPVSPVDRLELADWRRRISDLYAAVRTEAASDPERAWRLWRETREVLYRTHPQSPLPATHRADFTARHWPYDERYRVEATVESPPEGEARTTVAPAEPLFGGLTLALPVSTGGQEEFTRIGSVDV
jgi:hypothetical protein